jgi:sphingosine kinase
MDLTEVASLILAILCLTLYIAVLYGLPTHTLHSLSVMSGTPGTHTSSANHSNPFEDPAGAIPPSHHEHDATAVLTVDRNATLTLGTDALIVLDEGLVHRRAARNCCGLLPQLSKTTWAIPFYHILWAELNDFEVTIHYARTTGEKSCKVGSVNYAVSDKTLHGAARQWVKALMDRAYPPNTLRQKRVKVLINPFGGKGHAQKLWTREIEPIFAAARCDVDVVKTGYRGHATEIAEKIDLEAYDVIACASGDGTPHEVFNGLAKHKDARRALKKIAVVQLPCGSGNAMSLNLTGTDSPSLATVAIVKGVRTAMDLVAITQGEQRYYSFLSQAVGIIAESDLGTENLRWMGSFRFTWGLLVRLLGKTVYPVELSFVLESDDKHEIKASYRQHVAEQNAARAKLDSASETEDNVEATSGTPPALRYGTASDTLPSAFQTIDLPTLGNFYTGNMVYMTPDTPFFPASLPSDGHMDMVTIDGLLPRLIAVSMLTTIEQGTIMDFSELQYRKVKAYRITPRTVPAKARSGIMAKLGRWLGGEDKGKGQEGHIAIDGERVPFAPFQAEVVSGLATVLSKRAGQYEFDGPPA